MLSHRCENLVCHMPYSRLGNESVGAKPSSSVWFPIPSVNTREIGATFGILWPWRHASHLSLGQDAGACRRLQCYERSNEGCSSSGFPQVSKSFPPSVMTPSENSTRWQTRCSNRRPLMLLLRPSTHRKRILSASCKPNCDTDSGNTSPQIVGKYFEKPINI